MYSGFKNLCVSQIVFSYPVAYDFIILTVSHEE